MNAPPSTLGGGRYVLGPLLGEGGVCQVFAATDTLLQVERAAKILMSAEENPRERNRLIAEAQMLAQLHHKNILAIYDAGSEQGVQWVVVELSRGGTLLSRIARDGPLPLHEATEIILGVLSALGAAHAIGIVHRDVKPSNILLDPRGLPCLGDFGIAKWLGRRASHLTTVGTSLGTPQYMAPEQRYDATAVGPTADLYACGATLYAAITGGTPMDLFAAEVHSPRWDGIPDAVVAVIRRAMSYDPVDRFPDAQSFARALLRAVPSAVGIP